MPIARHIESVLIEMAQSFPVVTITGPRQSGKTTLVRMTFPEKQYVSLEDLDARQFAGSDPRRFLNQFPEGAILDEIQHVPELLSYIQTIVDDRNRNGLFFLTGSNQFQSMHAVSQSLAGRTGILKLLPFTYSEAYGRKQETFEQIAYSGLYPRIFDQHIRPELFLTGYLETYLQRDVRFLLKVKDLMQFHRFLKLCAGRTGQILNLTSIGNDLGATHKTIKEWISILEASYIVYLLKPYYHNYNKRIIKSPKLYFLDVGIAAHLLGIESAAQIPSHPLRGALFETFIISEFLKARYNLGKPDNLFYFRDQTGNEVDVILETGSGPIPIEIKSAQTVSPHFFHGLEYFKKMERHCPDAFLIMGSHIEQKRTGVAIYGFSNIDILMQRIDK
jgi:hypothetical protein